MTCAWSDERKAFATQHRAETLLTDLQNFNFQACSAHIYGASAFHTDILHTLIEYLAAAIRTSGIPDRLASEVQLYRLLAPFGRLVQFTLADAEPSPRGRYVVAVYYGQRTCRLDSDSDRSGLKRQASHSARHRDPRQRL